MRVPDEAGSGQAKVTFSFADWKEGHVAPATFEVPIFEAEAKNISGGIALLVRLAQLHTGAEEEEYQDRPSET